MNLKTRNFILLFSTTIVILTIIFLLNLQNRKDERLKDSFNLSSPLHKKILYAKIDKIIKDFIMSEINPETGLPSYKNVFNFSFKDVRAIQDTSKQKLVVNFQLYKPFGEEETEVITFVMITFLRKEIDIVEWSYSDHFVQASEDLFETDKNNELNTNYVKQK